MTQKYKPGDSFSCNENGDPNRKWTCNIYSESYSCVIHVSIPDSFQGSQIATSSDVQYIQSLLPGIKTTNLLYRGTRDGFSPQDFYSKAEGKGATLTIMISDNSRKFGGYTSKSWIRDPKFINDTEAFLFSLDLKTQYKT